MAGTTASGARPAEHVTEPTSTPSVSTIAASDAAYKGQCFCGAITFTIVTAVGDPPIKAYLCHCLDCQRFSGSSFAHNATFSAADVHITLGAEETLQAWKAKRASRSASAAEVPQLDDVLSTYGNDAEGRIQFCGVCGTRLFLYCRAGIREMRDKVVVPVGVIEDSYQDVRLAPSMEGWVKRKACWMPEDLGLKRMGSD
ncbi:Mss4-like protein [Microdochium bolleyi]|uniref:Mss4-like protein n=1 Tax=Microdochium bolleyi TaxID=196109 RepID=A0A136IWD5_9PEZI|nr:Mss4-like protein [Microdochium bolleyi]